MILGAVVGGGLGLVGSFLSDRSNRDASEAAAQASQFRPFALRTGAGGTGFDLNQQTLTSQLDPSLAAAQGLFNQGVLGGAGATFGTTGADRGFQRGLFQTGRGLQTSGLAGVGQDFARAQQVLGAGIGDIGAGTGAFQSQNQLASLLSGNIGAFGFGRGQELLGQDFGDVRQQELDLLRGQARPFEERTTNATLQNLFSTGRLGTTGGAQIAGNLALAQEQADIGRQLAATQTAQGLRGQNIAAGQGLLGIGGQQAGLLGNLGLQGLEGLISGTGAASSRAQQRLANAQGLFGFGGQVAGTPLGEAANVQNLGAALSEQERAMLALSINAGGAQASAGANVGRALLNQADSPLGGFFGEVGTGILDRALFPTSNT